MIEYPTLKLMRDQVARQIGDQSPGRQTKIDEWLNIHYADIARKKPWPQLMRSSEEERALTAGDSYVYLPKEVEQLYLVLQANQDALVQASIEAIIRGAGTAYRTPGGSYTFADAGEFGRRQDFYASGEKITLSTSGSAAVSAVVHGVTVGKSPEVTGQEIREELTISPSTGATTTNTFKDLFSVSVAPLANGAVVTAAGTTSTDVYATIGEGESTARYKRIRIMQPDAVGSLVTCVWKKRPFKLISDHQSIEIPVGTQLVEACIATMMVNQREYNAAAIYHAQRSKDGVEELFKSSQDQNAKVYLAQPIPLYRTKRITVINP